MQVLDMVDDYLRLGLDRFTLKNSITKDITYTRLTELLETVDNQKLKNIILLSAMFRTSSNKWEYWTNLSSEDKSNISEFMSNLYKENGEPFPKETHHIDYLTSIVAQVKSIDIKPLAVINLIDDTGYCVLQVSLHKDSLAVQTMHNGNYYSITFWDKLDHNIAASIFDLVLLKASLEIRGGDLFTKGRKVREVNHLPMNCKNTFSEKLRNANRAVAVVTSILNNKK